jgi:hypothetical protein
LALDSTGRSHGTSSLAASFSSAISHYYEHKTCGIISMETSVDFQSELFRPFLPDDAQVNPRVYGAELVFWLSQALGQRGVMTSYPNYEDWGWFLEYITADGNEYWLCCANVYPEQDKWRCYLDPKARKIFGRDRAPADGAVLLMNALRDVLAGEKRISGIRWSEERPGKR